MTFEMVVWGVLFAVALYASIAAIYWALFRCDEK